MITYVQGNIFDSPAQVITNTINCVGVMGAGLAIQFKNQYPDLFEDYLQRCQQGEVKPGIPYLFENDEVQVLNFPTKRHWKEPSQIKDIEAGLSYLASKYKELGIYTLALPPLGCGQGGLQWSDVKPIIEKHLAQIIDLEVFVYEPITSKEERYSEEEPQQPSLQNEKIAAKPQNIISNQ